MEDELERLLHDARAGEATRSRASVIALRELAAENATLSGVLQDLADERRRVRLAVRGSLRVGAVVEVWSGGVVLAGSGVEVLVRAAAIDVVTSPDGCRLHGDERVIPARSWAALVHDRVDPHDDIELTVAGYAMRGRALSVGVDVTVLITIDGTANYVRTDSIDSVVIASARDASP